MPRKGRELEQLVEILEKNISDKQVEITSPAFLEDRVTGQQREIDVLLVSGSGRHKQLTAFECKDWNKKVGVPEVEAFHTKISDLKINKAIVVSSEGFAKTAIVKANFYNISCLHMDEVANFDWLLADSIPVYRKKIIRHHWQINGDDENIPGLTNYKVIHSSGVEFTEGLMEENMHQHMRNISIDSLEKGKRYRNQIKYNPAEFKIVDIDTNTEYKVTESFMYLEYELDVDSSPLKLVKYSDISDNEDITHAAIANIDFGHGNSGHLSFVEQEDGSKKVTFTPCQKPNK